MIGCCVFTFKKHIFRNIFCVSSNRRKIEVAVGKCSRVTFWKFSNGKTVILLVKLLEANKQPYFRFSVNLSVSLSFRMFVILPDVCYTTGDLLICWNSIYPTSHWDCRASSKLLIHTYLKRRIFRTQKMLFSFNVTQRFARLVRHLVFPSLRDFKWSRLFI